MALSFREKLARYRQLEQENQDKSEERIPLRARGASAAPGHPPKLADSRSDPHFRINKPLSESQDSTNPDQNAELMEKGQQEPCGDEKSEAQVSSSTNQESPIDQNSETEMSNLTDKKPRVAEIG